MVVVDSSVLIPLLRIGKLPLLKSFFGKIDITREVYEEINVGTLGLSEFEEACGKWIIILSKKFKNTNQIAKSENIEQADASVILLAKSKETILLSNDYALIIVAKNKGIKCWWATTFILRCLQKRIIKKKEAKQILLGLIKSGMRLDNEVYAAILDEIDKS
jgi:predicted nucleic acid-binding protein